jgi:hypothetical protein
MPALQRTSGAGPSLHDRGGARCLAGLLTNGPMEVEELKTKGGRCKKLDKAANLSEQQSQ